VDFSDLSAHVLGQASRIAAQNGSALQVIHVFFGPWRVLHYRAPTPQAKPEFKAQYFKELQSRLEQFVEAVLGKNHGLQGKCEALDCHYRRLGTVEYAAKMGADMIVVGVHRRGRIRRLLMGSTAEHLASDTTSSILAIRAD
jgi:nucleotide-binding universal stress UspA family protein